jgi:hypothetical protein
LFSEVAVPAGVGATLPAFGTPENSGFVWHGAAAGDFNNDNWIDLFVTVARNRNYLYLNDGKGGFRDASDEAGVKITAREPRRSFSITTTTATRTFLSRRSVSRFCSKHFQTNGKLEFHDVSLEAGVAKDAIGFSASRATSTATGGSTFTSLPTIVTGKSRRFVVSRDERHAESACSSISQRHFPRRSR